MTYCLIRPTTRFWPLLFNRNTNTNDEGGTDDEEFRIVAVIDRLNTTYEIWQGITMSCVQCHTHPYDPFRHEEFYQSMAFFNNTADKDLTNDFPRKELLSPGQSEKLKSLQASLAPLKTAGNTMSEAYKNQLQALLATQPGPVPIMEELKGADKRSTPIFIKGKLAQPWGYCSTQNTTNSQPFPGKCP